jgi:hypothetical protein
MKTAELLIPQSSSPSPRRQEPHWDNRIAARLLALRIDRDLAEVTSSASPVTRAALAMQLTSSRSRHSLARSLDLLVERAEQRGPSWMSAAVAPCHEQVRNALPEIRAISGRLRTAEPVDARGVTMMRAILADGGGPCYVRSHSATLTVRLKAVSRCLRVAY